ncbi:kinase-like domain-containing protein [Lasiosphaeria ovina]|uniref:Kinase-like domain-containing protein n=1 Tax=Lasiosphaeria ovina TaxID=92902 RepID=A0AAE0JT75_9PEZI|nr:kinase-like domain-containing protein [Lasiosphaeria ovina]
MQTPHLAKLLATFENTLGPSSSIRTGRHFCLMFEKADSHLGDLWHRETTSLEASEVDLARWVAKQCHGLADGMNMIHDYKLQQDSGGSVSEPRHGFHGDIKAENILLYHQWAGYEDPLGLLQITDFGISSFHHTASALDISHRMIGHPYRPPENQLPIMKTTPSHDIWALGCLYLEFLTWLVKGPAALGEFLQCRITPDLPDSPLATQVFFYDVTGKDDHHSVVSISQAVIEVFLSP